MMEEIDYQKVAEDIDVAYDRIKDRMKRTPLVRSPWLSGSSNVFVKWEEEQITNSFKLRGATNRVTKLLETSDAKRKIVAASSGNHGLACAKSISGTDVDCTVFVPEKGSLSKINKMKRLGVSIKYHGADCLETEGAAKRFAEEMGATYISPYNNLDVIAGQGTIGIEILEDLPSVDAVFLSVGGGGLASGVAIYLKNKKPSIKVIGCQPENSKVMYESVKHGSILDIESLDTLSDGTAGGVEQGSVTFPICKDLVDEWVLVTEDEISSAVYQVLEEDCKVIEGASGVAVASFLKTKDKYDGKNVVIVSCGGNISIDKLKFVIDKHHKN